MSAPQALAAPYSPAAEQGVLGALLADNRVWDEVGDVLRPEAFHAPEHRAIWSTISRLVVAGKLADPITVHEAGGHELATLTELLNAVVSAKRARHHAAILVERWQRREAMRTALALYESAADVDDGTPVAELLDDATGELMRLQEQRTEQQPQRISDLLGEWIDRMNARADGQDEVFPTGLRDLDNLTAGGGRRGELWVLGARPSMGKSASALTVALNLTQSVPALVLTQEDSVDMFVSRCVASEGRVNLAHLRNPKRAAELGELDKAWDRIATGVDALNTRQLLIDDQGSLSVADVRRKIRQAKRMAPGLVLVVVDYLQLMAGDEGDNRNQMLGAIANGLNALAKSENVWIMLLSQLSRKADERSGVPQMADLRDSGDIESAAHVILLLHRESRRNPKVDKHWAQVHVCKQKNGPTDTVSLYFDGASQRFSNWEGPEPTVGIGTRTSAGKGLS